MTIKHISSVYLHRFEGQIGDVGGDISKGSAAANYFTGYHAAQARKVRDVNVA